MKRKKLTAALTAILCAASTFAAFPVMHTQAAHAVYNDFEETYNGWHGSTETVGFDAAEGIGYQGTRGMAVTGRQTAEEGAASSKGFYLWGGVSYRYSVKVKADTDETFSFSVLTIDPETGEQTVKELDSENVKAGEWATLSGSYKAPKDAYEFELKITTDSTADFYMDNTEVLTTEDTSAITAQAAEKGLKDEFTGYFRVGNILNGGTIHNSAVTGIILKDCNAVECENETKPDATLVQNGSTDDNIKVSLNSCAAIMDFCVEHNLGFRGHTMVWHSQMPEWFFKQGFNKNNNWVDKSTMNKRMESYIKNMFDTIQSQYPSLDLYAYDVCNECVSDDSGRTANNGGSREPGYGNGKSPWVAIYGDNSFVEQAFTYARKYAPADCKLYYNDYNEYWDHKRDCIYNMCKSLYQKGVLDGVGMQSHIGAEWEGFTGVSNYVFAMKKYLSIGCDVQITELDISVDNGKYSYTDQAKKYEAIFQAAMDWNTNPESDGRVTLIQIWGPDDGHTWLKEGSNALLYDRNYQPKEAYNRLISMIPESQWGEGVKPATPPEADENGYWMNVDFDNQKGSFSGRGSAKAEISSKEAFSSSNSLYVSGREATWNGAETALNSRIYKAGETYSFSTNVMYTGGEDADTFYLSLQYKGSDGETHYDHITEGAVAKGNWVQLTNTGYKLPADGSDFVLYVEMPNSTSDFYMDDVIVAKDGIEVKGAGKSNVRVRTSMLQGDVDGDGVVDVFDLALAKHGMVKGFANKYDEQSADIDSNGTVEITDLLSMHKFIHKLIDKFPERIEPATEPPTEAPKSNFNYDANLKYKDPGQSYLEPCSQAGKVTKETYNGIRGTKSLNVYTPYNYDPNKKYNIFYLMHGGGENENTLFSKDVKLNNILDHMIMKGELEPMIVVTPTFNGQGSEAGNFWDEFKKSVVPFVEGKYSTYAKSTSLEDLQASRMHRAYGGFSMGGLSTWCVADHDMDIVGYFMPLSGNNWEGMGKLTAEIDSLGLKQNEYFILAATGSDDIAYNNMKPEMENLKTQSKYFTYTSDFSKGNLYWLVAQGNVHWWGQVRWYVYDALPYFFHEDQ
ncbi:MAG: endo-1,4-beta-xylanase [Oscillospiraceae bacterium]|nr:endo-1,4-beta-xylanase [Oscillospiraceae bacterium]